MQIVIGDKKYNSDGDYWYVNPECELSDLLLAIDNPEFRVVSPVPGRRYLIPNSVNYQIGVPVRVEDGTIYWVKDSSYGVNGAWLHANPLRSVLSDREVARERRRKAQERKKRAGTTLTGLRNYIFENCVIDTSLLQLGPATWDQIDKHGYDKLVACVKLEAREGFKKLWDNR